MPCEVLGAVLLLRFFLFLCIESLKKERAEVLFRWDILLRIGIMLLMKMV